MQQATQPTDEEILARAQQIKASSGGSLTDAMLQAEIELQPKAALPTHLELRIALKPRVMRWVLAVFGGHSKYSVEARLSAYVEILINEARRESIRSLETPPQIEKGRAHTIRADKFENPARGAA